MHAGKGDEDDESVEMKLPNNVRNIATVIFKVQDVVSKSKSKSHATF